MSLSQLSRSLPTELHPEATTRSTLQWQCAILDPSRTQALFSTMKELLLTFPNDHLKTNKHGKHISFWKTNPPKINGSIFSSFWNGPFFGDMLIVGGYIHSNVALEVLEFSFLRGDMLNCCRSCKHTSSSWTNSFEKYARQIGSFPEEIGVKTKKYYINSWYHHLVLHTVLHLWLWLDLYVTVIHLEIAEAMGFCFFCSKCWIYRIVILLWFLLRAKSNLRVVCRQSLPFFNSTLALDIRIPLENRVFSGKHLLRRCVGCLGICLTEMIHYSTLLEIGKRWNFIANGSK